VKIDDTAAAASALGVDANGDYGDVSCDSSDSALASSDTLDDVNGDYGDGFFYSFDEGDDAVKAVVVTPSPPSVISPSSKADANTNGDFGDFSFDSFDTPETAAAASSLASGDAGGDYGDASFYSFDERGEGIEAVEDGGDDDGYGDGYEEDGEGDEVEELSAAELAEINAARSDDQADGSYFDSYAHLGIHREMIGDEARTGAYLAAIEAHAAELKGKVVLDVGCGTGILSMFAARAGARKVYAVDASGITRHTRRLIKANGFEDVIEVIRGRMEDIGYDEITEPVDVVVSEWMGYALLFESMLPSVVDARDRFMKPGGLVLPNVATVHVALLSDQTRYDKAVTFWEDVYGFDFSGLIPQTKKNWASDPPVTSVDPTCLASASAEVDS